jgi:hypothetical protein
MRFLILAAVATALAAMSPPAQAAASRHNRNTGATGAPATVYQQLPYGGYGYGTDPDPNVRSEMLRDPPNDR